MQAFFLLFALVSVASAFELTDWLRLNGFGTVGVSTNDRNDLLYSAHPTSSKVGKSQYDFRTNNVAGLQGTVQLSDALSATGQGLIRDHAENDVVGELQWAYLQYRTDRGLTFRAGQFRLPIFQTTELAFVGYARTYASPPLSFYGVGGYEFLWGAQMLYQTFYGDLDVTLRGSYGYSEDETPKQPSGEYQSLTSDDVSVVSAQIGNHAFRINGVYSHITSKLTNNLANGTKSERGKSRVTTLSVEGQAHLGDAIFEGGYAFSDNELQPDERLYYFSAAYRIGEFKPYMLYSRKNFSNIPAQTNVPAVDESTFRQIITSLGCRYDVIPGVAIKYQFDRFDIGYRNTQSNRRETGYRRVHSLVADWMF